MIYIIFLIIALISLFIILIIIVRHFTDIKLLDTDTLEEEKQSQVKKRIVTDRLSRKALELKRQFLSMTKPAAGRVKQAFKNFHDKILELDAKMRMQKLKENGPSAQDEVVRLDEKAAHLMKEEKFKEAEDLLIELIKLDSKNIFAYQSIADLYILTKDYEKARETLHYVEKLLKRTSMKVDPFDKLGVNHERSRRVDLGERERLLAACYEKQGSVCELQGKIKAALGYYKKAVVQEPKNPKYLDLLLKFSIMVKDKTLAKKTLQRLQEADPENQKIEQFEEQLKNL